jgi:hypothetical protein
VKLGRRNAGVADDVVPDGVALGVLALPWRFVVTPDGAVHGDGDTLRWAVVAEDRVHHPEDTPSRRQRTVEGTPVVETSVRVPGGDVVVTAYAAADRGGALVLAVENRAGTSVAFAVNRADVVAQRPLGAPPDGGPFGASWRTLPLAHGSSLRVALPATSLLTPDDLSQLPDAAAVVRGWQRQLAGGLHVDLPEPAVDERLCRSRAGSCLAADTDPMVDPERYLHRAATLARLGLLDVRDGDAAAEVAAAAGELARRHRRAAATPWGAAAALVAAHDVLRSLGDDRGASDAAAVARRLPAAEAAPEEPPVDDLRYEPWLEGRLAVSDGPTVRILPSFPVSWRGANLSAYQVPTMAGPVGFAVRWHGARPALLWEAPLGVVVTCPGLDPTWSSTEPSGEALLAAPTDC